MSQGGISISMLVNGRRACTSYASYPPLTSTGAAAGAAEPGHITQMSPCIDASEGPVALRIGDQVHRQAPCCLVRVRSGLIGVRPGLIGVRPGPVRMRSGPPRWWVSSRVVFLRGGRRESLARGLQTEMDPIYIAVPAPRPNTDPPRLPSLYHWPPLAPAPHRLR